MAIAVPAVIKDARRRQLRRRALVAFALAAAVALTATWGLGGLPGGGGSGTTTFRSDDGWTVTYPSGFHRLTFDAGLGGLAGTQPAGSARGVSIGNFWPLPGADPAVGVPATGVLFQLYTGERFDGSGAKKVRLPLTLRDFPTFAVDPAHVRQAGPGRYAFQFDGHGFSAVVVAGRDASRADLHALSRLISSVRFPG